MNYVDFDEVVSEALLTIGAKGEDARLFAQQMIWRGLQKLGSTDDTIEVCTVYTKNLLLSKPKNLKKLEELALYDANGVFIPHIFRSGNKRIYPEPEYFYQTLVDTNGNQVEYCLPVDVSETKTSYTLGTNASMVSYALIRYYPYPMDAEGSPLIREDEVEALSLYARWRWSQKENQNQSEIQANKIAWMEAADYCKAEKKASDFTGEKRKTISRTMNRMIPNFNRSRF